MAVCSYDNPDTMRREAWKDGKLIMSMDASLFFLKESQKLIVPFQLGGHKWSAGRIWGDPAALEVVTTK